MACGVQWTALLALPLGAAGWVGHSGQLGVLPHKIPSSDWEPLVALGLAGGAQRSGDFDVVNGWPVGNMLALLGVGFRWRLELGILQFAIVRSVRSGGLMRGKIDRPPRLTWVRWDRGARGRQNFFVKTRRRFEREEEMAPSTSKVCVLVEQGKNRNRKG